MNKEITWNTNVINNNKYWSLQNQYEWLEGHYSKQINKMVNVYLFNEYVNEYEFYYKMRKIIIKINNCICACINDKFKGSYNHTYYDNNLLIKECEWCNIILINNILDKCRFNFTLEKGKDFAKYFFTAIHNFIGNIINKINHKVNKNKPIEISFQSNYCENLFIDNYSEDDRLEKLDIHLFSCKFLNDEEKYIFDLLIKYDNDIFIIRNCKYGRKKYYKLKKIIIDKLKKYMEVY